MEKENKITKEFISFDDMYNRLKNLLKPVFDEAVEDEVAVIDEDQFNSYVTGLAHSFVKNMDTYVHGDTNIPGNLMDIKINWEFDHQDISMTFRELIKCIDDHYYILESGDYEDPNLAEIKDYKENILKSFQEYAIDWFFSAFGTYDIKYNFMNYVYEG